MLVHARAALSFLVVLLTALAGSAQSVDGSDARSARLAPKATKLRVLVLPPDAGLVFRGVDGGVREWWIAELEAAGVEVVSRRDAVAAVAAVAGEAKRTLHGADAEAVARQTHATHVIATELRYRRGAAEAWMRVYGATGDLPIAAGNAKGKLAKLGELLGQAAKPLRKALAMGGLPAPVRLSELSAFERAGEALDSEHPSDAVPVLTGMHGRTADSLHEALARAMTDPRLALPERSRLASATGENDPDWLQVRQGIIDGKDVELLLAGAANAASRGEHARALELNQQAAAIAPDDLRARMGTASALGELDRHAEAREAWQAVLAADPGNLRAREALSHNPALSPAERAQQTVELADARSRMLDPDGALELYENAAALDPEHSPAAKLGAARLHARVGSDDEALLAYEELGAEGAERLGARAGDVYAGLGDARAAAGDADGAAEAYRAALGADPKHVDALQGQGELMLAAGRAGAAVAPLSRAVELAPEDADARTALARAKQATGDSRAALDALQADAVAPEDQPQVLLEAARIQRETGDLAGAQSTLLKAVAIAPDDTPLRSALAKVYADAGNAEAAAREQARVSALTGVAATAGALADASSDAKKELGSSGFAPLAAGFPATNRDGHPFAGVAFIGITRELSPVEQVRAWLLPRVLDRRALEAEIRDAFAARYKLVPIGPIPDLALSAFQRTLDFSTERADLSLVNDELGVESSFVGRVTSRDPIALDAPMTPQDLQLEVRMHTGRTLDQVEILAVGANVPQPAKYMRWNARALVPYGLLLALCLTPFIRGWGKLTVHIDYELRKNTKGFFAIEISRGPGKAKRERQSSAQSKTSIYQKKGVAWSRFKKTMVQRETVFRMIPARNYYVCVHGVMQDESGAVVGSYLEERRVRIPRGRALEVAFDFRPREASLEVRLQRPEGETSGVARVALAGVPSSLKFVKDDLAIFYVGRGKHSIVVGYGDCVYERSLEVAELTPHQLTIGLGDPRQAVFEGVRDAVEPFLLGDLATCARALDKAGMTQKAAELRAKHHEQQGDTASAAKFYREAGNLTQAAALAHESGGAESAELYEQAGDHRRAAALHLEAGNFAKAGQLLETAYDYNEAIEAYRRAGDNAKLVELLERVARHHEAGAAALAAGDEERAIRNFQQVDLRDPDYADACAALAGLFLKREEWVLAIDRLKEALHTIGEEAAPLEMVEQLGDAFERNGELGEALQTFESMRKRDYQYAGLVDRIRSLRGRMTEMETQGASQSNTAAAGATTQRAPGAAATPAAQSPEDRYEILGELGRGGMGIVYKARDRRLGRVVALKRLPDNLRDHPTAVALFLREAQSAAALNHPNIVTIYDADQAAGNYYLTMEFLEGMPLDGILKKRGKLSPRDAVRMGIQIAMGLQFAHERGIVHRDIKTANLFFTRERVVKIMDFGLAKMVEEVRKATTVIGGTPYYMAPEQALGERVDHRADLYAFGVTLFELLTGRVPFRDGDVTYHHRHTPAPDLRELVPGIPPELAALVARLMSKTPEQRPAATAEVTAALDALMRAG